MPRYNNDPRPHNEKIGEAHGMFNSCLEVSKLAGQIEKPSESWSVSLEAISDCGCTA